MGISAAVVRDTATLDGVFLEDASNRNAQNVSGIVGDQGEDLRNDEDGGSSDKAG
jgi:hypothetical protein